MKLLCCVLITTLNAQCIGEGFEQDSEGNCFCKEGYRKEENVCKVNDHFRFLQAVWK